MPHAFIILLLAIGLSKHGRLAFVLTLLLAFYLNQIRRRF